MEGRKEGGALAVSGPMSSSLVTLLSVLKYSNVTLILSLTVFCRKYYTRKTKTNKLPLQNLRIASQTINFFQQKLRITLQTTIFLM